MTDTNTRQRNTSISSLTAGSVSESPTSTRPRLPRSNSSFTNIMNIKEFSRYGDEWSSDALTLLDVIETFFDSRLDLINRRLKAQSARLKSRAVELLPKQLRTPAGGGILLVEDDDDDFDDHSASEVRRRPGAGSQAGRGDKYRREVEKEVERIKVKLAAKVTHLSGSWRSAQIVRTREKVSFLFGVMSLTFTCLLYGMAPTWLPFAYTAQSAFYLPTRIWQYKKKSYHYFLFGGLCYFVNILDLVWMWIFPQSGALFICSYLLTMGPLASAIITWRNSLVFHSLDKVTSLFIHMYPPTVLSVILHVYPDAHARYPGLAEIQKYSWWTMILIAAVPYVIWQSAYYQFISVGKKSKIESGQRENSFHYMLNDKRGPIGKALKGIRPEHRELWFIFGQLIYSIVFMIPPAVLFIHSPISTSIFLITIFAVSAWNGASFYVEVFGRKFERELEKLRKEMETASATGGSVNGSTSVTNTPFVDRPTSPPSPANGGLGLDASPLVLPSASSGDTPSKVDSFSLDRNDDREEVLVDAKE